MRRKDREMPQEFAIDLIDQAQYGVLSMLHPDGKPYAVPISFVREELHLYLHGALEGRKIEALAHQQTVNMVFVGFVRTLPPLDEATKAAFKKDENLRKALARKRFTTEYASAWIEGRASFVENSAEKHRGLYLLAQKYTPTDLELFEDAMSASLEHTAVIRIDLERITGKRKKYDSKGEEMKWGRIES